MSRPHRCLRQQAACHFLYRQPLERRRRSGRAEHEPHVRHRRDRRPPSESLSLLRCQSELNQRPPKNRNRPTNSEFVGLFFAFILYSAIF